MSASATADNPVEIARQRVAQRDQQRRSEFEALSPDLVAQIVAVPEWTFPLAKSTALDNAKGTISSLLDVLLQDGWIDNRASFVPGECLIVPAPPPSEMSMEVLRKKTSATSRLSRIGLAPAIAPEADSGEWEGQREIRSEEVSLPTGQLRCRTEGIAWRAMVAFPQGSGVRITLKPLNKELSPVVLHGMVLSCSGDEWSGYDTVTILDKVSQVEFPEALYLRFGVPRVRRPELIALLPETNWIRICQTAAEGIWHARRQTAISGPTLRWTKLARRLDRGADYVARRIMRRVEALLQRNLTGEVVGLLDAAAMLAQTVGADLVSAVGLGQRRLELHYREQVDEQRLKQFFERPEQIKPFDQLMAPDSPHWALHYLGTAGVGKTMLLRFLNYQLLAKQQAVARVDFDYLSADFPVRRPAQLLLELADGLRLHIRDTQTESSFREFQSRAAYIHLEVEAEPPPNDPLGNLHREEFDSVLSAFCDFLIGLPQPVVLFLDTCEELARLQPDGRFQPGVQATFEILERIQARLRGSSATLRVIFAGRRLLAISGAGWRSKGAELEERRQQFSVQDNAAAQPKDFLRLHEIRGFTRTESREYLIRRLSAGRPEEKFGLDHPLVNAIIERSRDNTTASDFERTDGHAVDTGDRFNPFDLSLYADWAAEDPKLSAATISEGGTDPYIEIRIISRIRQPAVLASLPTLLLLRRVTKIWLAKIFAYDDEALENLYRELCQIEWMDYQPSGDGAGAWLEVDRNLRPRLERYYAAPARVRVSEAARAGLARWVSEELKLDVKPEKAFLAAAMRLLPGVEAAAFWRDLETRIASAPDWHWGGQICENLLAESGTIGPEWEASVNATFAAAQLHTQAQPEVARLWQIVGKTAASNPIPEEAQWLSDRALAGIVGAKLRRGQEPSAEELSGFWKLIEERPSPNWGDAIEAIFKFSGTTTILDMAARLHDVKRWRDRSRFSLQVKGVVSAMFPNPDPSDIDEIERAAKASLESESASERVTMPDWPLPLRLHERLRLDLIDCAADRVKQAALYDQWREDALSRLNLSDSPWLIARILEENPPSDPTQLQVLTERVADVRYTPPVTRAQRKTSPLFVALAKAWNKAGDADQALRLLDEPLHAGKLDSPTTARAQRAKAEIIHQHRMTERAQVFLNGLRTAQNADPETLRLVEEVVAGQPKRRTSGRVATIISLVVGLLTVAVVFILFWKAGVWGFSQYSGWVDGVFQRSTSFGWRLGSFLVLCWGVLYFFTLIPRYGRSMRANVNSATVAHLELTSSGEESGGAKELAVGLTQRRLPKNQRDRLRAILRGYYKAFGVLLRQGMQKSVSTMREVVLCEDTRIETAWLIEQREMRPHLVPSAASADQDPVISELLGLLMRSKPNPIVLALTPDVMRAGLGWEDALGHLLTQNKEETPPENFAPFRAALTVEPGEDQPRRWRALDKATVLRLMAKEWTTPFRNAWVEGVRQAGFAAKLRALFVPNIPAASQGPPNFRICHLVGETVRSSDGIRFRLSDNAAGLVRQTQTTRDPEGESRSAEQLLLEEKGFFVVQEIPETSGQRSQTDRERTASMRRFANELFQGGAWAVLFIPNLPSALAMRIAEQIGRATNRPRSPGFYGLLALTRMVRAEITGASAHGTPEFLSELAWEVTLFARSGAHASLVEKTPTNEPPDSSETA